MSSRKRRAAARTEATAFFSFPGADDLWRRLGGFESPPWIGFVAEFGVVGNGPGAVRTVVLRDGTRFRDVLREVVGRCCRCELADLPAGVGPVVHELKVWDDQPGLTIAHWRCSLPPDVRPVPEAVRALAVLFEDAFGAAGGHVQ